MRANDEDGDLADKAVIISLVDRGTGYGLSCVCGVTGSESKVAIYAVDKFLDDLGYAKKVILQTDQEPGIMDLVKAVASKRKGTVILQTTPRYSSSSNGGVERFHQSMQGLARTWKCSLERMYNINLKAKDTLVKWLVRHAWIVTRYQKGVADDKTPFERVKEKKYTSDLLPFGERVLYREPGDHVAKLQEKWNDGLWLGRSSSSDEHIVATSTGIELVRSVRRVIHDQGKWLKLYEYYVGEDTEQGEIPTVLRLPGGDRGDTKETEKVTPTRTSMVTRARKRELEETDDEEAKRLRSQQSLPQESAPRKREGDSLQREERSVKKKKDRVDILQIDEKTACQARRCLEEETIDYSWYTEQTEFDAQRLRAGRARELQSLKDFQVYEWCERGVIMC